MSDAQTLERQAREVLARIAGPQTYYRADDAIAAMIAFRQQSLPGEGEVERADTLKLADEYAAKKDWNGAYHALRAGAFHQIR